jgi:hypothetical protein
MSLTGYVDSDSLFQRKTFLLNRNGLD